MANLKLKIAVILFTLLYFFSSTAAPVFAAITYTYDQNGNIVSDGTKCYEYNEANQQKRVKNCSNNQTIAEYVYDYQGNRLVKKTYSSGALQKTTFSPNDGYETVKLASNSATQNTSYYFANDQLIAKKNPDGTKNYYHNDHLGSTNVMTNHSGSLVEETKYDPWGEVKTGGTKSKFLYTGQEKDLETSLNYYNARYYDSHIRRFTQPDDIIQNAYDPQSLNRYSYVNNNPLRYTDPTGHCWGPIGSKVCGWVAQAASKVWSFAKSAIKNPSTEQKITKVEEKVTNNNKPVNPPAPQKPQLPQNNLNSVGSSQIIPKATNTKLNNIIQDFYSGVKNPNRIGSGTTSDAMRYEIRTGLDVFGREHKQKGQDLIRGIDKVLKDPKTSQADIDIANSIKADLQNALKGR